MLELLYVLFIVNNYFLSMTASSFLLGILIYNDLTSTVTSNEFSGTGKLLILLIKLSLSLKYDWICFAINSISLSKNHEISEVWQFMEFIIWLPELFCLWTLCEMFFWYEAFLIFWLDHYSFSYVLKLDYLIITCSCFGSILCVWIQ